MGINILGSLILGAFLSASMAVGLSHQWRLFVAVGLCGGFTTFSAFSADTVTLIEEGAYVPAFLYVLGSCALSIAACFAGAHFVRAALGPR
jgi:CrcB protein